METAGIPTVTLARQDFVGVFRNAVAGLGLAPDAAMVTFPMPIFLPESDISPLTARKQEFYDALMHWRPASSGAQAERGRMVTLEAPGHEEALTRFNQLAISNLWGDGLPAWIPTRERVDWILRGSAAPRTLTLGKMPPRGGVVSVEACAIALAMAGGRPEYLPVLLAAVEAFLDASTNADQLQAASGSAFPVVIVNGPIGKQIRLNSGFGCLGPDPQHPSGASIGRALRLMQQNLGGALPGTGAMANYGGMRYTNAVFAEDEDGLPEGWVAHGTARHGFEPGTNSISLVFASGAANIRRRSAKKETAEEDALQGMHRMADFLRAPNLHCIPGYVTGTPGVLMIPNIVARRMAELGWTQKSIVDFLWEHSKIPMEWLKRSGSVSWIEVDANPITRASLALDPWPIAHKAQNLILIVAGGGHPTNSYWLQGYSPAVIGRKIALPAAFDQLLAQADRDLGCASEACAIG
jgi:hypothetical protein